MKRPGSRPWMRVRVSCSAPPSAKVLKTKRMCLGRGNSAAPLGEGGGEVAGGVLGLAVRRC